MDTAQVVFNKKARQYTVALFGQTYVGHYETNFKVGELLDVLFTAWDLKTIKRTDLCLLTEGDLTAIPEQTKISKLLIPKAPKCIIGCTFIARISGPSVGSDQPIEYKFPLSVLMPDIANHLLRPLHADQSSFSVQYQGRSTPLPDFLNPLVATTLEEFIVSSSNSLLMTAAEGISMPRPPPASMREEISTRKKEKGKSSVEIQKDKRMKMSTLEKRPKMTSTEKARPPTPPAGGPSPSPPSLSQSPPPSMDQDMPPAIARPEKLSEGAEMKRREEPSRDFEKDESALLLPTAGEEAQPAAPSIPTPPPPTKSPTKYTVNMGLEYFSVMMERQPYLFYIHLSQQELRIETEEGKVVYQTTFTFVAKKEEPPVLELKVYGEGFEIHPLSGKVTVIKDAINPPVIIFSVMPVPIKMKDSNAEGNKKQPKKKKKGPDLRHLHVVVTYENDTVNHTVLGVTVQPKHYQIQLGPLRLNVSKPVAMLISVASSAIASYSIVNGVFEANENPSLPGMVTNLAPGMTGWVAIILYFVALAKAIKPLKETWTAAFAAGKLPGMMK